MPGLRGDPFLTSLPLPSPSLLTEATYRIFASSSFQPNFDFNAASYRPPVVTPTSAIPGLNKTSSDMYERRSSLSFEPFLRLQTPAGLKPESSEASSYFSDVSTAVTPPLSATLSDSSNEHSAHSPEQRFVPNPEFTGFSGEQQKLSSAEETTFPMVMLNSTSYASALHSMVSKSDKLLPASLNRTAGPAAKSLALWQHLKASTRAPKDLANDGSIMWSSMPANMLPTTEQQRVPHHRCIDLGLPWASVRSRLLDLAQTDRLCLNEFLLDILLSLVLPDQRPSFYVYGDDPYDPECWELSASFAAKWSGIFDESILRRSNWWRRQRGLAPHSLPDNSDVRNRLGTGSTDESSRIWTAAFPSLPLSAHL